MTPEERLTKLASDIKDIRERGQPKIFPDAIRSEAVNLLKILGSTHIINVSKLSPSILYQWRKKMTPDNSHAKDSVLNITRCVLPKHELSLQKPLIVFIKNGIKCEMYNETIAIKIADEFLK